MFGFNRTMKGCIGIAIHSNGSTIAQCNWSKDGLVNPRTTFIELSPRNITAQDWRSSINAAGLTGSTCSVALPPSILDHHVLRLPNMDSGELAHAVGWELADRIGRDRELLQIDARCLGSGGDVLGVSIDKTTIAEILDPLYSAGLRPSVIEPSCFSIARILGMRHRRIADRSCIRAVLDFASDDSAMMVLAGDEPVFYKRLRYSGNSLIDAVSSFVGVNFQQATHMLQASDQEADEAMSRAVREATRSIHEQIARDAMKCLRHYGVTSRGPAPEKLIVTGSSGWNRNLSAILETACNMTVSADWDIDYMNEVAWVNSDCPCWQTALGTSLCFGVTTDRRRDSDSSFGAAA